MPRRKTAAALDTHRALIRDSDILTALIEHAEGRREMSSSQVSAALGLLKKALPDLATVTLAGAVAATHEDAIKELE